MFIALVRQLILAAFVAIALVACGGTSTDPSALDNSLLAPSDNTTTDEATNNPTNQTDTTSPSTPSRLRTSSLPSVSDISLVWDASTDNVGVVSYRVYRNDSFLASASGPSYQDDSVQPNTTYTYYVIALDAAGNQSGASNLLTTNTPVVISDETAPTAPSNLQSSGITSSQLTISWTASSDNVGVAGYRIFRNNVQIASTSGTSFTDGGLNGSTTYQYVVQAYDTSNNSANSASLGVTTLAAPPPQSITVSWEDPSRNNDDSCINQLQGYILHYGTSSGSYSNSVDIQLSHGGISCTQTAYDNACGAPVMTCTFVTEVLPPDTWYFAIQAYDQPGNTSSLSNEIVRVIN